MLPTVFRSVLKSVLLLVCVSITTQVIARDKQPRRFETDGGAAAPASTSASKPLSTDERIARLESILDSQGLVDLVLKIESLQKEIQQLRDDVETQGHTLNSITKRQRDLYVDLDRRMLQLERGGRSAAAPGVGTSNRSNASVSPAPPVSSASGKTGATVAPVVTSKNNAAAVSTPKPSIDPIKEQNAYQKAFDLLRELRYDQAITEFRSFIVKYPNGRYAHIAQYWLSEASYAQRHFKQAITDYQKLINNYPNSPKLAESMLKIAYSYYELGDYTQSRSHLEKLVRVYPGTTAASQGQNLLKNIKIKQSKK